MADLTGTSPLLRIIVSAEDLDRACAFYGDLLGLEVQHRERDIVRFALGDRQELLLHRRQVQRGDAAVAACFRVDDVRAVVARWRAEGGEIIDDPVARPWGETMAVARDPDGHIVCLSEVARTGISA